MLNDPLTAGLLQLCPARHLGRKSKQASTRWELCCANRNKIQTFRSCNADSCLPTLLPIKYRIEYKIAVIVYNVITTQEPSYLADVTRLRYDMI